MVLSSSCRFLLINKARYHRIEVRFLSNEEKEWQEKPGAYFEAETRLRQSPIPDTFDIRATYLENGG